MKLGTRLPDGVLRLDPPEVDDRDAFQRLDALVRRVVGQLAALGPDPIAIAASPNRFDDAWTYDWRAVRCGDFFSEKESYMGKHDLDRDILTAPPEARAAHSLLGELQEAGWRDLFADAFGTSMPDQTLSIVVQDKLTWLVFSSNNLTDDEGDPVFAIWEDAELSYFGEAKERFELIARVLKPGGVFSMIEASDPKGWWLRPLYLLHLKVGLPLIERIFLRGAQDFAMIGTYSTNFGSAAELAAMLRGHGLEVEFSKYFFGCATGVAGRKAGPS